MQLTELLIYPVKSCGGIALSQVSLDRFGPAGDRRWLVVDTAGRFITQRETAALALVRVARSVAGLCLTAGDSSLDVAEPGAEASRLEVQVWQDRVPALDAGDRAARWLGRVLGRDCRLVYMPDNARRPVDPRYATAGETVSFADGFPLLLISQGSLDELNRRLDQPVPMNRFRPNLVVDGCEPFAEDRWERIRIGAVELRVVKPCARCVVPSIDQHSGRRDPQINRVLASFRRRDGNILFGQNLLYEAPGTLRRGDPVEVLARR